MPGGMPEYLREERESGNSLPRDTLPRRRGSWRGLTGESGELERKRRSTYVEDTSIKAEKRRT